MVDIWDDETHSRVLDDVAARAWTVARRHAVEHRPADIVGSFGHLSPGEVDHLKRLHFLLSDETERFVLQTVPSMLKRMPQSARATMQVVRNFARGRIDWGRTLVERAASGCDPTVFAVHVTDRSTDVPENRLVAFLLDEVVKNAGSVLGTAAVVPGTWTERAAVLATHARRARGHASLVDVRTPASISGRDAQVVRTSRHREVRAAVDLYDLYDRLFLRSDENTLRELMLRRILAPADRDTLYELWTLFRLAEWLEEVGWPTVRLRLIGGPGSARRPAFRFEADGTVLDMMFQSLPDDVRKLSQYKDIFTAYDIDVASRRPDITLRLTTPTGKRLIFVEVKRTTDRNYIVDSVYKTLGYLADFQAAFAPTEAPKGVLVVWGGIARVKEPESDAPLRIATHGDLSAAPPEWLPLPPPP